MVILLDVNLLLDSLDALGGDIAGALEAVGDLERVDALIEKSLGLIKKGASEHGDTSGAVTDLVVLRLRELNEEARSLVLHLHLLENSRAVVCHDHVAVRAIHVS